MISNLYRYRKYIFKNALNELRIQYAGSMMGIFWNVLVPLLEIAIFATVFANLIAMKVPGRANNRFAFVLYLCCGLFPWRAFSSSIQQGSRGLRTNARYLTNLAIPEEIFVAKQIAIETMNLMIYLFFLVIIGQILGQPIGLACFMFPVAALLFQMLAFGISLFLASIFVFFEDIGHVLGILLHLWMWVTPIVWVETVLSPKFRTVFQLNPAYPYLKAFRELFLCNQMPSWDVWAVMVAWAIGAMCFGYLIMQKLRPELRDVL